MHWGGGRGGGHSHSNIDPTRFSSGSVHTRLDRPQFTFRLLAFDLGQSQITDPGSL